MLYIKATYITPVFAGEVLFRFPLVDTPSATLADEMMYDYGGCAHSFEQVSFEEWDLACARLHAYTAYPSFGDAFDFALAADLDARDDIAEVVLSNVEYCQPW